MHTGVCATRYRSACVCWCFWACMWKPCDAAKRISTTHTSLATEQLQALTLMGKVIIFQESTSTLFSFQFTLWESLSTAGGMEEHKVMRWNGTKQNCHSQHPHGRSCVQKAEPIRDNWEWLPGGLLRKHPTSLCQEIGI